MSEDVVPEKWEVEHRNVISDCGIFKLVENTSKNLSNGASKPFFVLETSDWANVIPVTNDGEIILIEQFRHGVADLTLEIPGGVVDSPERPSEAARRELLEETGFQAAEIVRIGESIPNPAIQNNRMHHFLATGCKKVAEPNFDSDESIATSRVAPGDINELLKTGRIAHALVVAAFCFYHIYENRRI